MARSVRGEAGSGGIAAIVDGLETAAVSPANSAGAQSTTSAILYDDSDLTDFLIVGGMANPVLGNRLYWRIG